MTFSVHRLQGNLVESVNPVAILSCVVRVDVSHWITDENGRRPEPAPVDRLHSHSDHMPALISVCSVAAFAASFCCSAAAMEAVRAISSFKLCCEAAAAEAAAASLALLSIGVEGLGESKDGSYPPDDVPYDRCDAACLIALCTMPAYCGGTIPSIVPTSCPTSMPGPAPEYTPAGYA
jgi:hypothetical protein